MSERAVLSVREQEGKGLVGAPGHNTKQQCAALQIFAPSPKSSFETHSYRCVPLHTS